MEQPKAPKSPQQHSASTATLKKRNVTTGDATRSVANMLTNDNLGISKRRVAIASRMSEGRDIMSPGAGRMEETSKKNGSEIVKDTLIDTSVKETIFTFNILKMTSFIQVRHRLSTLNEF